MKQLTIVLVFGGESSEHDVSINSARNVYSALDKTKYDVVLAYIDAKGKWWKLDEWTDAPDAHGTVQLVPVLGDRQFVTAPGNYAIQVDVLFPVLHGKHGEDGSIQGLADMMHIPIVGCGIESSALCMNKEATKLLAEANDIPIVPWVSVRKGEDAQTALDRITQLHEPGPWFVKPARAGSSVGVSKVNDFSDMAAAIKLAHQHDSLALVEVAIVGRELEVAVLGNPPHHTASQVGEIMPGNDFYDYDDKYSETSASRTSLNAKLPESTSILIRHHALNAYQALGCTGLARVDFLLSDEGVPYLNEINTLPGFTNISMYPKLWQQDNISYSVLVDRLIELVLE